MDYQNKNHGIQCSVSSCSHHNDEKSTCDLNSIKVCSCGPTTSDCACTECGSFELSKKNCR